MMIKIQAFTNKLLVVLYSDSSAEHDGIYFDEILRFFDSWMGTN